MGSYIEQMEKEFKDNIKALHFFDSNCWIGRSNNPGPVYPSTVSELLEQMDYCGIEKAIVSHTLARYSHPLVGNEILLQEISVSNRLQGCFILLPSATGELGSLDEYIENMLKKGVYTARIFPESHNFSLEEWSSALLLGKLEERKIPLFIWSRETDWDTLYTICKKHPQLPLILERCDAEAFWNARYVFPLLEKCENLFVEVHKSHLYLEIDEIVKRFGAERLIFSTYFPVDDPHASLMLVTDGDFSQREKERIAHKNLEKLIEGVSL